MRRTDNNSRINNRRDSRGEGKRDNRRAKDSADSFMKIRKKFCRFCRDKVKEIDYKDLNILEKIISEKGKIFSTRTTGTCAKHQRKVASAVKRARFLSLIPYTR